MKPMLERPEVWSLDIEPLADGSGGGGMFEYFGFVMIIVSGTSTSIP